MTREEWMNALREGRYVIRAQSQCNCRFDWPVSINDPQVTCPDTDDPGCWSGAVLYMLDPNGYYPEQPVCRLVRRVGWTLEDSHLNEEDIDFLRTDPDFNGIREEMELLGLDNPYTAHWLREQESRELMLWKEGFRFAVYYVSSEDGLPLVALCRSEEEAESLDRELDPDRDYHRHRISLKEYCIMAAFPVRGLTMLPIQLPVTAAILEDFGTVPTAILG